jgi:predicted N-formylglutamate amidohydrolase
VAVEIRQDLIAQEPAQRQWAALLARCRRRLMNERFMQRLVLE